MLGVRLLQPAQRALLLRANRAANRSIHAFFAEGPSPARQPSQLADATLALQAEEGGGVFTFRVTFNQETQDTYTVRPTATLPSRPRPSPASPPAECEAVSSRGWGNQVNRPIMKANASLPKEVGP